MDELVVFFQQYGLVITLIAVLGIAVLGILKYCNVFKKIEEKYRHYIYIGISVGISIIATVIYLAIVKRLDINYVLLISGAIYALNQTFYNIFKVTPVNELFVKILDFIKQLFTKKTGEKKDDSNKDSEDKGD